ncbi:MAG TPA: hypothetical protein VJ768_01130, partial [Anaerolineales bacterium]|nr:hypothetical protein [Anaerolineales bacterium]
MSETFGRNPFAGDQEVETVGNFDTRLKKRHRVGRVSSRIFKISTFFGILVLSTLLLNIADSSFGYIAVQNSIEPDTLAVNGVPLEELSKDELVRIFEENVSAGLFRRYEDEIPFAERTREDVYNLIMERVVEPEVVESWTLQDSLFNRGEIERQVQ